MRKFQDDIDGLILRTESAIDRELLELTKRRDTAMVVTIFALSCLLAGAVCGWIWL